MDYYKDPENDPDECPICQLEKASDDEGEKKRNTEYKHESFKVPATRPWMPH